MPVPTETRRAGASRPKPNLDLLRARISKGLSRGDLAHLTGLSEKQVGLIERGVVRDPRVATAYSIASALEADVLVLFPVERRFTR